MKISFGADTDVGKSRDHNEDAFLVDRNLQLFVVCDGMGGHAAGEVASAMTVNVLRDDVAKNQPLLQAFAEGAEGSSRRSVLSMLEQSIQHAGFEVHAHAAQNPEKQGMGTTVVAMLVVGTRCFLAHVGDSRVYLLRQGLVHQLTEDHALVAELVKQGRAGRNKSLANRYKHAMTRAVGVRPSVEVDSLDFDLLPGDRYLLCTDGLHGYLEDESILEQMEGADDDTAVRNMIDFANDQGGQDNITAVILSVPGGTRELKEQMLRRKLDTIRSGALFKFLTNEELLTVVKTGAERDFAREQIIVREGEHHDSLFVVLTGAVKVVKQGVEVARLTPGMHFGEMALVDRQPRSADVVAEDGVRTLVISRAEFYEMSRRNPALAVKLLWAFLKVMNARLRATSDELTLLKSMETQGEVKNEDDQSLLAGDWLDAMASPTSAGMRGSPVITETPSPTVPVVERPPVDERKHERSDTVPNMPSHPGRARPMPPPIPEGSGKTEQ